MVNLISAASLNELDIYWPHVVHLVLALSSNVYVELYVFMMFSDLRTRTLLTPNSCKTFHFAAHLVISDPPFLQLYLHLLPLIKCLFSSTTTITPHVFLAIYHLEDSTSSPPPPPPHLIFPCMLLVSLVL